MHAEFPHLTFDFTAKIEHILEQERLFAEFAALGCTFVTTAIESLCDRVLQQLGKGHTAADVNRALSILAQAGLAVQATLVAFTPWTTLEDYLAVVDFIAARGLQENIRPVQLSIRLLVPPGSPLAEQPQASEWLGELEAANFGYRWQHPDPRMDRLHAAVSNLLAVAEAAGEPVMSTHARIRGLAYAAANQPQRLIGSLSAVGRPMAPRLTEDWFC